MANYKFGKNDIGEDYSDFNNSYVLSNGMGFGIDRYTFADRCICNRDGNQYVSLNN